jgi:hypothetical protein
LERQRASGSSDIVKPNRELQSAKMPTPKNIIMLSKVGSAAILTSKTGRNEKRS